MPLTTMIPLKDQQCCSTGLCRWSHSKCFHLSTPTSMECWIKAYQSTTNESNTPGHVIKGKGNVK